MYLSCLKAGAQTDLQFLENETSRYLSHQIFSFSRVWIHVHNSQSARAFHQVDFILNIGSIQVEDAQMKKAHH